MNLDAKRSVYFVFFLIAVVWMMGHPGRASAFAVEDAVVLRGDPPDHCARPAPLIGPANLDARVRLWIDWTGYVAGSAYRYEFYAPNGDLMDSDEYSRDSNSDGCTWSSVSESTLYRGGEGTWTVKFYYDDTLYHSDSFSFEATSDEAVFVGTDPVSYIYLVPSSFVSGNGILACVHGASRDYVGKYIQCRDYAKEQGLALLAPHFDRDHWSDYAWLYSDDHPFGNADDHFDDLIDAVAARTGADPSQLYLYGYSGGGQFVHRYMLAHPEKADVIKRIAIGGPGTWAFPRSDWDWGYGLGKTKVVPDGIEFDLTAVNAIEKKVFVGALDVERDDQLSQGESPDLEGYNRVQRAAHWVNRMNLYSLERGLETRLRFEIVDGYTHTSWDSDEALPFLFDDYPDPSVVGVVRIDADAESTPTLDVRLDLLCQAAAGCQSVALGSTADDEAHFQSLSWSGTPGDVQWATMTYRLDEPSGGHPYLFARFADTAGHVSDFTGDLIVLDEDSGSSFGPYARKVNAYFLGVLGRAATAEELAQWDDVLAYNSGSVWRPSGEGLQFHLSDSVGWNKDAPTEADAVELVETVFTHLFGSDAGIDQRIIDYYVDYLVEGVIRPLGLVNAVLNDLGLMPRVDGTYGRPNGWLGGPGEDLLTYVQIAGYKTLVETLAGLE